MSIALLANPDSGAGDAEEVERMLRERSLPVSRFDLDRIDDLLASRPERIVVAGGDGSIGPAAAAAARAGVPLGVVAAGTANDFAASLGLPEDPEEATILAASGTATATLDLGRAEGRPFVNAVSAGLSPVAARRAEGLKGALGPFAYAAGAITAGLRARPEQIRIVVDGATAFDGRAWQATVGLTGAFGGGAEVDADPSDGLYDVVVMEAGSRARLIAYGYGLRAGRIERHDGVITARGRTIEIAISGGAGFNVDGELVDRDRLRLELEPGAFEIVIGD